MSGDVGGGAAGNGVVASGGGGRGEMFLRRPPLPGAPR